MSTKFSPKLFFGLYALCLLLPLAVAVLRGGDPITIILVFSTSLGWVACILLMRGNYRVAQNLLHTAKHLDSELDGNEEIEVLADSLKQLAEKRSNLSIAVTAEPDREARKKPRKVVERLSRIAKLAKQELGAKSCELALYDERSGAWSQVLLLGDPITSAAQAMSLSASEGSVSFDETLHEHTSTVISRPLSFAGNTFGGLRLEFEPERIVSEADKRDVELLAWQGALAIVDTEFARQLLKLRRLSEESTKAKTGFLANLSHEIRGPLGTILNGTELALDGLCGELTPELKQSLGMIKDCGDHLLDLVNDVLDYAKVEAGKINPNPVELPLCSLLEDLTSVVRSQAIAKGHTLTLRDTEHSLGVVCDKRHIRQILINFLTNAVKYTPEGGTIEVWAERAPMNRVKINIRDTGIGIPESERDKVFGAFERVNDKYALAQVGTGLGMPLTKSLAEVNNGNVDFESEYGNGSTFWVVLPSVEILEEIEEIHTIKEDVKLWGHGESILVVDHDPAARMMLSQYLNSRGFNTITVGSPGDMIKAIRQNSVGVAILESDFPGLPGEELVATLRSIPSAGSIPLILVSSKAFVFDIERFLKLGVDRCLTKPVSLGEVASTARRLLDQSAKIQRTLLQ